MADISMCSNLDCPVRTRCWRSAASGTKPHKRQAWMAFTFDPEGGCGDFISLHQAPATGSADFGAPFKGDA